MEETRTKRIRIVAAIVSIVVVVGAIFITIFAINFDKSVAEARRQKLETLSVQTASGAEITTAYTNLYGHDFHFKVPSAFRQLTDEEIETEYQNSPDALTVFSNEDGSAELIVNQPGIELAEDGVREFSANTAEELENAGAEISSVNVVKIDGRSAALIKYSVVVNGASYSSHLASFSENGKVVSLEFLCHSEVADEWEPVAEFLIDSLHFGPLE